MTESKARFAALMLVLPFGFWIVTALLIAPSLQWIGLRLLRVASKVAGAKSRSPSTQNG